MMKISEMPKYEVYKDSGVEWLGDIPASWSLLANKHIFRLKKKQVGKRSSEYDLLSLTLRGVIKRDMENPEGKFPAEFDTYQEVRCGDFIFCLFDVEETPRTVGLSPFNGMITGAYTVFELNDNFDNRFLYYFYMNLDAKKMLKPLYRGLRNTIPKDSFLSFKTFVPPHEQQTRIANFLDKKTALIDEAISIKEKQISLLKERKQIIIQQAVTQGLDPNVPMKDSGVDWIGKIPEHWEVKRIKHVGKIINGYAFPSDAFIQEGARVMKISNIQTMRLDWSDSSYVDALWLDKTAQFRIYKGDLVFALTRPVISTGIKAALVDTDEPILLNQRNAVFRPNDTCDKNWIYFVLLTKGFINDFEMQIDITGQQPNISTVAIGNLPFPLPPELEQKVIVSDLSRRCALLDMAVDDQIAQIERLKEYKTSLINSAVTGKIKITPEMVEQ
ncbi:restriction endonuclease subunit S [Proteus mirabilis]|uniref:restriction endonuclease subunit S n=1 Tax=Proteus mirabilis TaxID=584 RepID=UPI0013E013D2|nr:restriction endonuclease subunit S [Proteus mirabilis]MCT0065909.1 restriction endonuclease subunit S [Proteus mirabilis]QIF49023.1 restriction endonuclease subunit S [Proteus mirabilis]HCQ8187046.1 restriction endonuclease subunit S [Proteus mirabilis]